MKTNTELRASLNMVLARLDGDARSSEEWDAIESALSEAAAYAGKTRRMRKYFEDRHGQVANGSEQTPAVDAGAGLSVKLTPWREVQLWSAEDMWAGPASYDRPASKDGCTGDRADVLRLMREYKRTGAIRGAYLADPDDYLDNDDHVVDYINDAGPTVEGIDWTDIDNA